jgi:hypothetical protein
MRALLLLLLLLRVREEISVQILTLINDFELVGDVGGRCAQRRFQVVPFVFQRNKLCVAHAAAATVDRASAKTNKTHFPSQAATQFPTCLIDA